MTTGAVQTIWAELLVGTLADAGVTTCVVSPGSRSTPLVAALAADDRFELPTIIDERAAAFYALGVARATGAAVALVCTSGSAAAHYYPAIVEASLANVPLVAITSDRPPELQHCGASQTIDQVGMYGRFVRAAFDVGAPVATEHALRALRRTVVQAIAAARGPRPGPVQLEVPLRKPLEAAAPSTDSERALAAFASSLRGAIRIGAPKLVADSGALAALAARIAAEPRGAIVAGALPIDVARSGARDHALELARRTGYPVLAEASSQLRFARRDGVAAIDRFDLVLAARLAPEPALVIQLGAEPVAAAWQGAFPSAERWILADSEWLDPDSRAAHVIVGDLALSLESLARCEPRADRSFSQAWLAAEQRAAGAVEAATARHPRNEADALRAALGAAAAVPGALVQLGNSLPIRVVDLACAGGENAGAGGHNAGGHNAVSGAGERFVISQRGAAGIDGHIASATGATCAGPVVLVIGDVAFAHDLGALIVAKAARAPLAIVVIDNAGGRIFEALPVAKHAASELFERHWLAAPGVDPVAVAAALGVRACRAETPSAIAAAVAAALAAPGPTVVHAPVSPTGARDVRTTAIELAIELARSSKPRSAE
ncbi:MAG TPA: 2-succinyl-5-enolpyruvyl-6-hydroxy-3-cyclohexene-1-carboxylic-acid synthase [Kofleriaceae bacterium]